MRCATTSLRYCNLRHGEYLLSNHDGWDDGQTTQKKPLRHITPGQENIETTEDSPWRRNLRVPGHYDKTGDMHRRGDSYVEKKYLAARTPLGRTFPQTPHSTTKMKWKTMWELKKSFFFSFKAFCGIRSNRFCSLCIERKREEIGLRKKHSV